MKITNFLVKYLRDKDEFDSDNYNINSLLSQTVNPLINSYLKYIEATYKRSKLNLD